jgi:alpha/beta superfamily hydrolase
MARQEERAVAIPLRAGPETGLALEGLYVAGRETRPGDGDAAVIAPPHPLYGGSMDSPVVSELAYACAKAGLASLRFNWSGVGASAGEPSGDPAAADTDYDAAIRHLAETHAGRIVACGYSFGAAAALRAAAQHPRVARLVLVAPPPPLVDPGAFARFEGSTLILAGGDDRVASPAAVQTFVAEHARSRLVIVPEADHFFAAGLAEIGRVLAEWLAQ